MSPMNESQGTTADCAYEAILRDLVERAWPADARLKSIELAERYDVTPGAVREALIRLAAKGFLQNYPQRGFRTIKGTARSVGDHASLRVAIDVEAAELSIERGDLAWEADLAAAHHRLSHLESKLGRMDNPSIEELRIWTKAEHAFHGALSSACGSPALIEAQHDAFVRFRLHLMSIDASWGFRGTPSVHEHQTILEAALARDAVACRKAIRAHFEHYPNALAAKEIAESS